MENSQELDNQLDKVKKMKNTALFLRVMMVGFIIVFLGLLGYSMFLTSAFVLGVIIKLAYDIERHNFSLKLETLMIGIIKEMSNSKEGELPSFLK